MEMRPLLSSGRSPQSITMRTPSRLLADSAATVYVKQGGELAALQIPASTQKPDAPTSVVALKDTI